MAYVMFGKEDVVASPDVTIIDLSVLSEENQSDLDAVKFAVEEAGLLVGAIRAEDNTIRRLGLIDGLNQIGEFLAGVR